MNARNWKYWLTQGARKARKAVWRLAQKDPPLFVKIAAGVWLGVKLAERF